MLRFDEKSVSNKHSLFSYVQSENEFPHSNKQWDDDGIHPKNVAFVATAFVQLRLFLSFHGQAFFQAYNYVTSKVMAWILKTQILTEIQGYQYITLPRVPCTQGLSPVARLHYYYYQIVKVCLKKHRHSKVVVVVVHGGRRLSAPHQTSSSSQPKL